MILISCRSSEIGKGSKNLQTTQASEHRYVFIGCKNDSFFNFCFSVTWSVSGWNDELPSASFINLVLLWHFQVLDISLKCSNLNFYHISSCTSVELNVWRSFCIFWWMYLFIIHKFITRKRNGLLTLDIVVWWRKCIPRSIVKLMTNSLLICL